MTPERIDQLVEAYRYRAQRYRDELLREQRRQLAQSTAYRNALIREYQRRLAAQCGVCPDDHHPAGGGQHGRLGPGLTRPALRAGQHDPLLLTHHRRLDL